ncbi:MAG: hypothetical protein KKE29_19940 [Proteobacteria bacterium]|nr:hypothetical protein [Pseudomonadota bacterium]MBV1715962.1 hypothetical protein [Desulfarculus sp.]
MCEPTTLAAISIGTTVFTTGLSLASQYQQIAANYDYQVKMAHYRNSIYEQQMEQSLGNLKTQMAWQAASVNYQNKLYLENAEAANQAYIEEVAAVGQQQVEAGEAASQELEDIRRAAQERVGQALASNQFSGMNLDAVLADTYRQEARYRDAVLYNLDVGNRQRERSKESLRRGAESKINAFTFNTPQPAQMNFPTMAVSPIQQQTLDWGSALGNIGNSVFGAFTNFATRDPKTGKYTF